MELFGIALSVPVAFVASALYCLLLFKTESRSVRLSHGLRIASYFVFLLFSIEIVLLLTIGAVRSRGLLGPGFYVAHLIILFAGPPALANILVIRSKRPVFAKWYVVAALCTLFAFFLVLLQYSVSESLFGIDEDNGSNSEQFLRSIGPWPCGGFSRGFFIALYRRNQTEANS
jgi:hypothetical protein